MSPQGTQISSQLNVARPELEARREAIIWAIVSRAERPGLPGAAHAPLDYQRARRRPRYSTAE